MKCQSKILTQASYSQQREQSKNQARQKSSHTEIPDNSQSIANPVHLTKMSDTVAFELDSKASSSNSLPSIELDMVFDDKFEIDPDVLMPCYADDTKNRAMNSKTIAHLSFDLEHFAAQPQNPLCTSTGMYRVRSASGDMSCLRLENIATRSHRLEQYFEDERKWREGFFNQPEETIQQPNKRTRALSHQLERRSTGKPVKMVALLSKAFRK
mmetsp:Transcript_3338/g.5858  ORF Transcript_3338/g.5858 Transcript_3338/m.5858 type:complete len:212 (+) Transcript_3338:305-940(+)|eukprot:CAMPEP_0184700036 /NCGR_PEP_ID=MMETSP0313-20130426/7735_1 /TAXON_ID=2792 /ORGANISM="Porphyridium aerugineum, Strain SAG 1380-2" /LENGTH=211 /DNA_ID=CAMNT_0027159381 /DNA_START=372 /DNA_END=1007 /DNA_ORIENTATION=+